MTDVRPARPRAFRLDAANVSGGNAESAITLEAQPHDFSQAKNEGLGEVEADIEIAQKRSHMLGGSIGWGGVFWSAAGALVSLGVSVWFWGVVENLFARAPALGWAGLGLAAVAAFALLVMLARELSVLRRQRRIANLHAAIAAAHLADDGPAARVRILELAALYTARPQMAAARAKVTEMTREIIDGRDLIEIAERNLMQAMDDSVRKEIALAARRVSLVTAISPRALLDVIFVAAQAVRMTRRIAEIYGGRPGFLGFWRLARAVASHLALTGGMAVGDSLVQQVLGHGLAARLSARLGEGVLNGLLTARVGLSAMAVCRPMPFISTPPPGINDVAPFLFRSGKE